MSGNSITQFVDAAREKGSTDLQIKQALLQNGWAPNDVDKAIAPVSIGSISVPLPPAPHFGMWVGFLYVILFIALYISATSFGGILHYFVDDKIPDALDSTSDAYLAGQYLMQTYLSSLIVSFPIFSVLFLFLKNQAIKSPAIRGLKLRKILIYLTLIGTFLIMLGHLIFTVYNFLGGSITARSLAHFGVTVFVAGSIFVYFLMDVWGDRKQL